MLHTLRTALVLASLTAAFPVVTTARETVPLTPAQEAALEEVWNEQELVGLKAEIVQRLHASRRTSVVGWTLLTLSHIEKGGRLDRFGWVFDPYPSRVRLSFRAPGGKASDLAPVIAELQKLSMFEKIALAPLPGDVLEFSGHATVKELPPAALARTESREVLFKALFESWDRLPAVREEVRRDAQFIAAIVPDEPKLEEVEKELSRHAKEAHVDLVLKRLNPADLDETELLPWEARVTGPFLAISMWLSSIGKLDRFLNVHALSLEKPRFQNGVLVVDGTVRLNAFRFKANELRALAGSMKTDSRRLVPGASRLLVENLRDPPLQLVGVRDPFWNVGEKPPVATIPPASCATQAELAKDRNVLTTTSLDGLALAFSRVGSARPCAMLRDANGGCHVVKIGDHVGTWSGRVSHLGRSEVTITEKIADASAGAVSPLYIPLTQSAPARPPDWFCPEGAKEADKEIERPKP